VVFSTLFQSDLCLTLGTNVRFEAALFNLSLKKRARSGGFNKASFGSYDSGFSINKSLGNSTSSNNKFIEGQSFFCKKFSKARRPFLVVGTSFLKRIDSDSLQCLVKTLSNVSSLVLNTWLGFNFLSLTSNCFSELLLSLKTANRHQINHKRVIYLLGPDSTKGLSSKLWYKNSFIISQQPFLQGSSFTTLLLPASLFVEKQSEYINLEGRLQITTRALVAPDLAKDDAKILSFFFSPLLFSKFSSFSHSEYAFDIKDNYSTFTRNLLLTLEFGIKKRFHLAEKTTLVNFFSSNVFTSNSPLMLKSATHFTKLAQTFLLL
jgi:NADH dehydrogenase/NADH:ubiquinone oxidoreductase subunit G